MQCRSPNCKGTGIVYYSKEDVEQTGSNMCLCAKHREVLLEQGWGVDTPINSKIVIQRQIKESEEELERMQYIVKETLSEIEYLEEYIKDRKGELNEN